MTPDPELKTNSVTAAIFKGGKEVPLYVSGKIPMQAVAHFKTPNADPLIGSEVKKQDVKREKNVIKNVK